MEFRGTKGKWYADKNTYKPSTNSKEFQRYY